MEIILDVPQIFRRGSLQFDQVASVQSGLDILELIDGYKPIKNSTIIDFGCGSGILAIGAQGLDLKCGNCGISVAGSIPYISVLYAIFATLISYY